MKNETNYEICDTLLRKTYTTLDDGNTLTYNLECQKRELKPNAS